MHKMIEERSIAYGLSAAKREYLLSHVDGSRPFVAMVSGAERAVRIALMQSKLIYPWPAQNARPTHTRITTRGRLVLALVLGAYADALVRAGYEITPPANECETISAYVAVACKPTDSYADVGATEALSAATIVSG